MATVERDIRNIQLTEDELWEEGPPHEVFKRMRAECPVHRTDQFFSDLPEEPGFWSVTTAEDIHTVSRDWQSYSSKWEGSRPGKCFLRSSPARCSSAWTLPSTTASRPSSRPASPPSGSPTTSSASARSSATCSTGSRAATVVTSSTTSPSPSSHG